MMKLLAIALLFATLPSNAKHAVGGKKIIHVEHAVGVKTVHGMDWGKGKTGGANCDPWDNREHCHDCIQGMFGGCRVDADCCGNNNALVGDDEGDDDIMCIDNICVTSWETEEDVEHAVGVKTVHGMDWGKGKTGGASCDPWDNREHCHDCIQGMFGGCRVDADCCGNNNALVGDDEGDD